MRCRNPGSLVRLTELKVAAAVDSAATEHRLVLDALPPGLRALDIRRFSLATPDPGAVLPAGECPVSAQCLPGVCPVPDPACPFAGPRPHRPPTPRARTQAT